nr:ADP-ribosylation factor-like protein 2-binding protein isoform X3 [Paramormyrops kingsleyae]
MTTKERTLLGDGDLVEMEDLDAEDFALSNSSDADAAFDAVIGNIEDIIMEEQFQGLQQSFMEKYYLEFDDSEENKLSYTTIFNEYIELLEKHIEKELMARIPGFCMNAFTDSLNTRMKSQEISSTCYSPLLTSWPLKKCFWTIERKGKDVVWTSVAG